VYPTVENLADETFVAPDVSIFPEQMNIHIGIFADKDFLDADEAYDYLSTTASTFQNFKYTAYPSGDQETYTFGSNKGINASPFTQETIINNFPAWFGISKIDSPALASNARVNPAGNLELLLINNILPKSNSRYSAAPTGITRTVTFDY